MRGRRRAEQERAIITSWWTARIRGEAETGQAKSIGAYLDELLSEDELLERSAAQLAAHFDALISSGETTEQ